ncbi:MULTISPECIES: hypothetical protein [Streptomyces]|uniref:Uncharacterized protein n=2 Tax=Streptomyces TaxID=1883 RepID=A0ABV6TKY9_9ACTN|nr:hypothetical protein [Streptomyces melanogenes]GGP51418.1 hypothetical protein GCM10010278_30250 [Streptomyces melanogenes]
MTVPHQPPPPDRPAPSPWAATAAKPGERVTTRLRRIVEGLPDWSPLPPGETLVRRRRDPGGL